MARPECTMFGAVLFAIYVTTASAFYDSDDSNTSLTVLPVARNGKVVYMDEELLRKLEEESETWHWSPWSRTRVEVIDNIVREIQCFARDSIDSFPDGLFDDDQLRKGGFLAYVLLGIYAFTLLTIVCNDFFIPCVELICEDLKIPQNVAAATFMSVATSCPEFFVNVISTFLTESDMGIGTIVGSAIFNALGVAAIGALAAIAPITIEMRPVSRDVVIYMINVSVLVAFVWDGQIDWYEAVVFGVMYILYFVIMFNSMRMFRLYDKIVERMCKGKSNDTSTNAIAKISDESPGKGYEFNKEASSAQEKAIEVEKDEVDDNHKESLWKFPSERSLLYKIWWTYTWPLKLILSCTIPSPVTFRRLYPLTFIMCIIWIGANSYCVSWAMTVIGHTFLIPESVMGMTFLAFGGCLPEACSVFIMSRRGEGGIGVSNALGANSLAILFALGLPWLIRTLTLLFQGAEETAVLINSTGIDFVVGSLLVAVASLWITLYIGKFTLRPRLGAVLVVLYLIFITFAILVETGVLLDRGVAMALSCD